MNKKVGEKKALNKGVLVIHPCGECWVFEILKYIYSCDMGTEVAPGLSLHFDGMKKFQNSHALLKSFVPTKLVTLPFI